MIDCQAPLRGAGDAGVAGVDAPGEPVLIEKDEMEKEMEDAEKKENQRKLEEGDEFEVINHEKDEELREKGDDKKVEDMKVQVQEITNINGTACINWHKQPRSSRP